MEGSTVSTDRVKHTLETQVLLGTGFHVTVSETLKEKLPLMCYPLKCIFLYVCFELIKGLLTYFLKLRNKKKVTQLSKLIILEKEQKHNI